MIDTYYVSSTVKTPSMLTVSEERAISITVAELVKLNNPSNTGMIQKLKAALVLIQKERQQAYHHLKSLNYQVST